MARHSRTQRRRAEVGEGEAGNTQQAHSDETLPRHMPSGALVLAVFPSILSSLGYPEALRQVLYGSIIEIVTAAYTRITSTS